MAIDHVRGEGVVDRMFETQGPEAEVTEVRKVGTVNAAEIPATFSHPPALLLPFRIATRSAEVSSREFADLLVLHRAAGALMRCYNVIFADPRKRSATPPRASPAWANAAAGLGLGSVIDVAIFLWPV
jgi:hypothetical protein